MVSRYSRQMILPPIGRKGQEILLNARVIVIGAGGTASSLLMYLAGAGVGHLTIVDYDDVEMCNLHRQIIHSSSSIGHNKALSAAESIHTFNPSVQCHVINEKFTAENAVGILSGCNLVVDCTDNMMARYTINDACVLSKIPLVSGSAVGMEGQCMVFWPHKMGPCYRCLYQPTRSLIQQQSCQSCSDAGVMGPVPGVVGCWQSIEALKMLLAMGDDLTLHPLPIQPKNATDATPNATTCTEQTFRTFTYDNCLLGRQLYFDAWAGECHNFALSPQRLTCSVCYPDSAPVSHDTGEYGGIRSMMDSANSFKLLSGEQLRTRCDGDDCSVVDLSVASKDDTKDAAATVSIMSTEYTDLHSSKNAGKHSLVGKCDTSKLSAVVKSLGLNAHNISVDHFAAIYAYASTLPREHLDVPSIRPSTSLTTVPVLHIDDCNHVFVILDVRSVYQFDMISFQKAPLLLTPNTVINTSPLVMDVDTARSIGVFHNQTGENPVNDPKDSVGTECEDGNGGKCIGDKQKKGITLPPSHPYAYPSVHCPVINIPLVDLRDICSKFDGEDQSLASAPGVDISKGVQVHLFVLCRRGIDSLTATNLLAELFHQNAFRDSSVLLSALGITLPSKYATHHPTLTVHNIEGGLTRWSSVIDPLFPGY